MIKVRGLTKNYGPVRAVDDISFQIDPGEIIGLIGPNGAGKSTTMRILTTYLARDKGEVEVAGHSIDEAPLEVRRATGYLPESAPLYVDMAVLDYLRFVAKVRGVPASSRKERLRKMVGLCGLSKMVTKDIGQLSKGYRQRVGLAQALIHDPSVIILDEPMSGLDPNQIVEIRDMIREVGREKTVILSSHILPEVQSTCSRILLVDEGRLVADDRPQELVSVSRGGVQFLVTARRTEQHDPEKILATAEHVQAVECIGVSGDRVRLRVRGECDDPELFGELLFRHAVESGLPLSELTRDKASLEDVFKSLTGGGSS